MSRFSVCRSLIPVGLSDMIAAVTFNEMVDACCYTLL